MFLNNIHYGGRSLSLVPCTAGFRGRKCTCPRMAVWLSKFMVLAACCVNTVHSENEPPRLLIPPENKTILPGNGIDQEQTIQCVAINARAIEWFVNDVLVYPKPSLFTDGEFAHSHLELVPLIQTNGSQVLCMVWGYDESNVTSQPATISVLSIDCSLVNETQNIGSSRSNNDTSSSESESIPPWCVAVMTVEAVALAVAVFFLIVFIIKSKRSKGSCSICDDICTDSVKKKPATGRATAGRVSAGSGLGDGVRKRVK